jgi:hypothetical protein
MTAQPTVSLVPRDTATSPTLHRPRPATEHGLSPLHATTEQVDGKPYRRTKYSCTLRARQERRHNTVETRVWGSGCDGVHRRQDAVGYTDASQRRHSHAAHSVGRHGLAEQRRASLSTHRGHQAWLPADTVFNSRAAVTAVHCDETVRGMGRSTHHVLVCTLRTFIPLPSLVSMGAIRPNRREHMNDDI